MIGFTNPQVRAVSVNNHVDSRSISSAHTKGNKKVNKTDVLYKEKLRSIDTSLAISKQNVIKHIIVARNIEKSKHQVVLIKEALSTHIQARLEHENDYGIDSNNVKNKQFLQAIQSGGKVKIPLSDYDLLAVTESIAKQSAHSVITLDTCKIIYKTLTEYDDSALVSTLNKYDNNCGKVDVLLFSKIVQATSRNSLSSLDAQVLYAKTCTVVERIKVGVALSSQNDNDASNSLRVRDGQGIQLTKSNKYVEFMDMSAEEICWTFLKRFLRKKLLLTALTHSVSKHLAEVNAAATMTIHLHRKADQQSLDGHSQISLSKSIGSMSDKQIQHDLMIKTLHQSQLKQQAIQSKIVGEMAAIYNHDNIPLETLRHHKNALKYTQKLSLQGVETIISRLFLNFYMKKAFIKWTAIAQSLKVEFYCISVLKTVSAYKIIQYTQMDVVKRSYKAMQKCKQFMSYFQRNEELAAVLEIQRVGRGYIVRQRNWDKRRRVAAIKIQKHVRRCLAIAKVKRRRLQLTQRRQLRFILSMVDKRWAFIRKKRALLKVIRFYQQMHALKTMQRYYRGHLGRKRFNHFKRIYIRYKSTLLIQCACRRHIAVMKVKRIRHARKMLNCAIAIQSLVRGMLTRARLRGRIKQNKAAIKIQYMHLRHKAYGIYKAKLAVHQAKQLALLKHRSAVKIQKAVRVKAARRRVKILFAKRDDLRRRKAAALQRIKPVLLGLFARRRYKPLIIANTKIRVKNMTKIQRVLKAHLLGYKARIFVAQKRIQMARDLKRRKASIEIQRIVRGKLGRKKALKARIEYERKQALLNRKPYYYRMRDEYYRTQNMYHRPFVVKIQCAVRQRIAIKRVKAIRSTISLFKIIRICKRHVAKKKAIIVLEQQRQLRGMRLMSIIYIQRMVRGFITRCEMLKHIRIKWLLWFLREARCRKMTRRGLQTFRMSKNVEVTKFNASVKIQSLVRGKQAKTSYKHNYKRLVRQRNQRMKERKLKAVTKIQSIVRMRLGLLRVKRQRELMKEREKERKEMELLEASLDGLHEDFMKDLLVIRAQTGVRALLAKGEFVKRVAESRVKKDLEVKNARIIAATKIQALVRGRLGRKKYKKMLPALKKAIKTRMFCVECEAKMATKRCRQCKDRYCNECYEKMHMKGQRRNHNYETIRNDPKMTNLINGTTSKGGKGGRGGGVTIDEGANTVATIATKKANPKEWEEFYDNNAKAKYWFNKVTGEASWINPMKA